jgi:Ca-activated chloride channel family protein
LRLRIQSIPSEKAQDFMDHIVGKDVHRYYSKQISNCPNISLYIVESSSGQMMRKLIRQICVVLLISVSLSAVLPANSIPVAKAKGIESAFEKDRQQRNQGIGQEDFKIKVDATLVATDVTVIGKDVPELSGEDFIVLDNGVEQQVSHFSRNQLPLAVALLIDTSLTVKDFLPLIQIAAGSWLRNLDPEDRVVLFSFDAEPRRLSDLTYDRLLIANKISKLKFQWGTDLFGAIYDAAKYLQKNALNYRRAIIVISDNYHYGVQKENIRGSLASESARTKALEAAVTIYSIKTPSTDMDRTGSLSRMRQIAADTGGEILDMKSWTSLRAALSEVIEKLRMQYVLGFNPSDAGESGSFHKLAVTFADKDRCPDCRLLARSGYYSGVSTPPSTADDAPVMPERSAEETDQLLIQQSIVTVASTNLNLSDIPFKINTTQLDDSHDEPYVKVELKIDSSRVQFSSAQNRYFCKLHVAIFYADKNGKILGSEWKTLAGQFEEATYRKALEQGLIYSTTIPLETEKQMLSVVVYDEESDRVGSKLIKLR